MSTRRLPRFAVLMAVLSVVSASAFEIQSSDPAQSQSGSTKTTRAAKRSIKKASTNGAKVDLNTASEAELNPSPASAPQLRRRSSLEGLIIPKQTCRKQECRKRQSTVSTARSLSLRHRLLTPLLFLSRPHRNPAVVLRRHLAQAVPLLLVSREVREWSGQIPKPKFFTDRVIGGMARPRTANT